MTVAQWSTSAALNVVSSGTVGTGGINIDEGMSPSGVNNAIRDVMAQIATFRTAATLTGANPLTITYTDNGATGPIIKYMLDTASPAVNDIVALVRRNSRTSTAADVVYVDDYSYIIDPTNATATGGWVLRTLVNNVITNQIQVIGTGVTIPLALSVSGLITATGGQIAFPATQNASANANTLDDYEEGTWTPVLAFGGASVGITYANQNGRYTKIGNMVFFQCYVALTSKGSSVGASTISLPFAAASALNSFSIGDFQNFTGLTSALYAQGNSGALLSLVQGSATVTNTLANTAFTNTSAIEVGGFYAV